MKDELVRVLSFYPILFEFISWEVFQVKRHDGRRACDNCRGDDMSVVLVRKLDRWHQVVVSGHQTIANVAIHQHLSAIDIRRIQIRTIGEQLALPFVMNLLSPFGPEDIG